MDRTRLLSLYRDHLARLEADYGAAITAAGLDALVIHSGAPGAHSSFDDQYWPLRPTPTFTHWIALAEAHCAVVLVPGNKPRLIRTVTSNFWDGTPTPDLDHAWSSFEITTVDRPDAIAAELPAGRKGFIGDCTEVAASYQIAELDINPPALLADLALVRRIKSEYEVACLAEANLRSIHGHIALQRAFARGKRSELELHLSYLAETHQDASGTPYQNIVAIDQHAAVLHHVLYDRVCPAPGAHSLLVDAGANYQGYASDITRTVLCNGADKPSTASDGAEVFAELIERLDTLQQTMCSRLVAGVPYEQLHDQAHQLLAPILRELGIARGSDDELLEAGITRALFPHGLGHSLGLQVHDVGCRLVPPSDNNPHLRTTATTEVGMVFTIEPGCYFIEALLAPLRAAPEGELLDWTMIDRLAVFGGIRIEDNVVITAEGNRNLTRDNGLWTS